MTATMHRCEHPRCPGYPFKASELKHPATTCEMCKHGTPKPGECPKCDWEASSYAEPAAQTPAPPTVGAPLTEQPSAASDSREQTGTIPIEPGAPAPAETHGDETEIACPWCGEQMWLADDERWASSSTECEHCEKPIELGYDTTIYTTARRKERQP